MSKIKAMKKNNHYYHVSHMKNGNTIGHTIIRTEYDAMTCGGIQRLLKDLQKNQESLVLLSITELKNDEREESK